MPSEREAIVADILARNAGPLSITVWKDGSFAFHGYRDAELATRCEPDDVLVSVCLDTMEVVRVPNLQARTRLYEKLLRTPHLETPHDQ